jgi:excisionase family DNA binding protein
VPKLLTVPETAERLRISPRTVYRLTRAGKLTPIRITHKLLFDEQDLARAARESARATSRD